MKSETIFEKRNYGYAVFGDIHNGFFRFIGLIGRIVYSDDRNKYYFRQRLCLQSDVESLVKISDFMLKLNKDS